MTRLTSLTAALRVALPAALAAAGMTAGAASARARAAARAPVVVELFTAQGCTTCPEADAALGVLAGRKGVLALTLPVDYWDYLGWTDTLAKPAFTARQRAYIQRLKVREIYTPEVVVGGAAEASGLDRDKIDALVASARQDALPGPAVRLTRRDRRVEVGAAPAPARAADVWVVRYTSQPQTVKVKAGDNRGQTLVQTHVVRQLERLGAWRGGATAFALPAAAGDGLKTVVLVQGARGGKVLAVGS